LRINLLHSIRGRFVLLFTFLIVASMGLVSLYLINFIHESHTATLRNSMHRENIILAKYVAPFIVNNDHESLKLHLNNMESKLNLQISIIGPTGVNLIGNDAQLIHTSEVQMAIKNNFGYREGPRNPMTIPKNYYSAVTIRDNGKLIGILHIVNNSSQIQSNINHIALTILISGIIVTVITVLLGIKLAAKITKSVSSVIKGAQIISGGNLDFRIIVATQDETKDLAIAFNSMAISLQQIVHELSEEKDILYAVLETMRDGVIVVSQKHEIIMMNDSSKSMLRTLDTPLHHKHFGEVIRDHRLQELLTLCLTEHKTQHAELEFRYPHSVLMVTVTPLIHPDDEGALFVLHDLTQAHQMEITRKEFVSNVSHELRSPLAAIKIMAETLDGGALNEPIVASDFIKRINNEVDRMTQMTNDLLNLARLENQGATIQPTSINLREFLREFINNIKFQQQNGQKTFILSEHIPNLNILIDAPKIHQVLSNLVNNAIKFTDQNGIISVSSTHVEETVLVSVSDNGIGIPVEHHPHIFERFYKVDRSRVDSGTGLGLAITKHIIQLHNGTIIVESNKKIGTQFTFSLPYISH